MTIQEHYDAQKEREARETTKKLFAIIDKIMAHTNSSSMMLSNSNIDKRSCGVPPSGVLERIFD